MALKSVIDSRETGLRIAEEASIGVLPASPVWVPFEPNSYADFGGEVTTVPRAPINPDRQRKKGVVTDLDAQGGFSTDLTQTNLQGLLQGHFFADLRTKSEHDPTNVDGTNEEFELTAGAESAVVAAGGSSYAVDDVLTLSGGTFGSAATFTVTAVAAGVVTEVELTTAGDYTVIPADPVSTTGGSGTGCTLTVTWDTEGDFAAGDLIFAKNFDDDANNGLHVVTGTPDENTVEVTSDLVDDASPAGTISRVGVQAGAGDIDVDASGTLPTLTSTTLDFTSLGIVPGEWIFVGGDLAADQFSNSENNGFKRVRSIAANVLTIDKSDSAMVTEASTTETIRLFFGRVLKNETGTLVKRRTYQLERLLGAPDDAAPTSIQSQYETGSVANEAAFNFPSNDKVTVDLSFIALDDQQRTAAQGVKTGTRPSIVEADAFNTSTDIKREVLAVVTPGDEAPTPLFAYVQESTLSINNNASAVKAHRVIGGFEVSVGDFAVSGSMTVYFADVAATTAVRNNEDITFDQHLVKANSGISFDLPLITLGDGRPNVEKDTPITLPLSNEAASGAQVHSSLNHTFLIVFWDYLPDAADT